MRKAEAYLPLNKKHVLQRHDVTVKVNEVVGLFQVADGFKMDSKNCFQFPGRHLQQWKKQPAAFEKTMLFVQDNAPLHMSSFSTDWLASKGFKDD